MEPPVTIVEPKVELPKPETELPKVEPVPALVSTRPIVVTYSHYKQSFPTIGDYLPFSVIDEKYCISFVFKGDFKRRLKSRTGEYAPPHDQGWLVSEDYYALEIEEDEVAERDVPRKAYVAEKEPVKCCARKKDYLTEELKQMSVEEIREGGEKYRQLIEQRELEDIVFK
jgi:hypothetical protein